MVNARTALNYISSLSPRHELLISAQGERYSTALYKVISHVTVASYRHYGLFVYLTSKSTKKINDNRKMYIYL